MKKIVFLCFAVIATVTSSFATTDSLFVLPINNGAISTTSASLFFRVAGDSNRTYTIRCIIDSAGLGIDTRNNNGISFGGQDTTLINFHNLTPSTTYKVTWCGLYDRGTDTLITSINPAALNFTTKTNDTLVVVNDIKVDPTTDGFRIVIDYSPNGNSIDLWLDGMNLLQGGTNGQTFYQFSEHVQKKVASYSNHVDTFYIKDMPSCVPFVITFGTYYYSGITNMIQFSDTFRTLCKPGVPIGLKAYSGCKELGLEQFYVDIVPNDTTTLYLYYKDTSSSTWTTLESTILTKSQMVSRKVINISHSTSTIYMVRDLGIRTKSKDGILSPLYSMQVSTILGDGVIYPTIDKITEKTASVAMRGNMFCNNYVYIEYELYEYAPRIFVSRKKRITGNVSYDNTNYFFEVFDLDSLKPATKYILMSSMYSLLDGSQLFYTNDIFTTKGTPDQSSITSQDEINVTSFPNPFSSQITIENALGYDFTISDQLGRVVSQGVCTHDMFKVNTQTIPSGVFYLVVKKLDKIYTEKIIKN